MDKIFMLLIIISIALVLIWFISQYHSTASNHRTANLMDIARKLSVVARQVSSQSQKLAEETTELAARLEEKPARRIISPKME